jgi:hypothetical protein
MVLAVLATVTESLPADRHQLAAPEHPGLHLHEEAVWLCRRLRQPIRSARDTMIPSGPRT